MSAFKVSRPVEISSASCESSLISFPSEAVLTSATTDFLATAVAAILSMYANTDGRKSFCTISTIVLDSMLRILE